jgi:hypothetical protein
MTTTTFLFIFCFKNFFKYIQNEALFGLHRAREEQMRLLTSQLLLLEANLRAKQGKIDGLLNQRDRIISSQQETIRSLEKELDRCRNGSTAVSSAESSSSINRPQSLSLIVSTTENHQQDMMTDETKEPATPSPSSVTDNSSILNTQLQVRVLGREQGDESLDDSDSAVVIDDDHRHSPTFAQNSQVKVAHILFCSKFVP